MKKPSEWSSVLDGSWVSESSHFQTRNPFCFMSCAERTWSPRVPEGRPRVAPHHFPRVFRSPCEPASAAQWLLRLRLVTTAVTALMRRSCSAGWLFAQGANAPSPRTSDEAGRAGARDQQQPKSQAALATIEQTQHVRSTCGFSFVRG